jgi:hypothetical protein
VVALAVAAAAQVVAGGAVVAARTVWAGPPPAEEVLARVQEVAVEAGTYRFEGDGRAEARFSESRPGRGTSTLVRYRLEGAGVGTDRTRFSYDSGDEKGEAIVVGSTAWVRWLAPDEGEVAGERWVEFALDEPGPYQAAVVGTIPLLSYVAAAERPEVVSRDGGRTVLRTSVDDRKLRDDEGSATLELTIGPRSRLERIVVDHRRLLDGALDVHLDVALSGWGEPVAVEPPPPEDVDRTPGIEEERVLAFRAAPLYQPRGIPEGWVLELADVIPAEDTVEGCEQVELDYTDPHDPEYGYLWLYQVPATCRGLVTPDGAQAFRAGAYRGWVLVDPEYGTFAQVTVGATVVQADTDLTSADLARVLGDLVPLDFAVAPQPLAGVGQRTVTS